MKTALVYVAALGLTISGCSLAGESANKEQPEFKTCPGSIYPPSYKVRVYRERGFPKSLSVELEGTLKYDQCNEQSSIGPAPIVTLRRLDEKLLEVQVRFFPGTPPTTSFAIFDRQTCSAEPELIARVDDLPLEFKTEYPNGPECGRKTSAEVGVIIDEPMD